MKAESTVCKDDHKKIENLEKHTFTETYSKIKTKRLLKENSDYPFKKWCLGNFLNLSALFKAQRHQVTTT